MNTEGIKEYFSNLSSASQDSLLEDLIYLKDNSEYNLLTIREEQLNNKVGSCPHCNSSKYSKDGVEKSGTQRYRCKSCKRSFNSYTGTWLSGIGKKELLIPYIKLMRKGLSLDKIVLKLKINKKTALDWRHKISASVSSLDKKSFKGITESDETFFLHSEKGSKTITRKVRKRGGKSSKRGINDEQVATIVTMGRNKSIDLKVSCLGRIKKIDIEKAIGSKISDKTILCTDGHVSFKGFAIDNKLEHHVLQANLKQYTKDEIYHIQHVNSADSRLKGWINIQMHGVATKYLQNYLNWFRIKEKYKEVNIIEKVIESALDTTANKRFTSIKDEYLKLTTRPQN